MHWIWYSKFIELNIKLISGNQRILEHGKAFLINLLGKKSRTERASHIKVSKDESLWSTFRHWKETRESLRNILTGERPQEAPLPVHSKPFPDISLQKYKCKPQYTNAKTHAWPMHCNRILLYYSIDKHQW